MIKIHDRLWVGSDDDYTPAIDPYNWTVVHAARDPWHRMFVGYTGRGAPKESPEYLFAQRGKCLALNLFDTDDLKYVNPEIMRVAVNFVHGAHKTSQDNILIHCNKGQSRGPTIGMLCIANELGDNFAVAKALFEGIYPAYKPMHGFEDFARINWRQYYENIL